MGKPLIIGYSLQMRDDSHLEQFMPHITAPSNYKKEEAIAEYVSSERAKYLAGEAAKIPYAGEINEVYVIDPVGANLCLKGHSQAVTWLRDRVTDEHEVIGFNVDLLDCFLRLRAAECGDPVSKSYVRFNLERFICPDGVMSFDKWHRIALRRLLGTASYLPALELGKSPQLDAAISSSLVRTLGWHPDLHAQLFTKAVEAVSPGAPKNPPSLSPLTKKPATVKLPPKK